MLWELVISAYVQPIKDMKTFNNQKCIVQIMGWGSGSHIAVLGYDEKTAGSEVTCASN